METVTDFIFLGSKYNMDGDYSHEIKRCFLLGGKKMTNLNSVLKKQRYHFVEKVYIVKLIRLCVCVCVCVCVCMCVCIFYRDIPYTIAKIFDNT